jgi:hypothetical protein
MAEAEASQGFHSKTLHDAYLDRTVPELKELELSDALYPTDTLELAHRRRQLAPDAEAAFRAFSRQAFAAGDVNHG